MVHTKEYNVTWLIPNRVGFFKQYQEATVENVNRMIDAANELINSSSYDKVAMIVDSTGMQGNGSYMTDIIREFRNKRSNKWGFTVVIGVDGVMSFFAKLLFQVARVEVRIANDMDEALEIIYRIYPDLPSITA